MAGRLHKTCELTSEQYQGMGVVFLFSVSHKTPERREEKKGERGKVTGFPKAV